MSDEDLKKIRESIKDVIRPLKELTEVLKNKVDSQDIFIHSTAGNIRSVKEQQSVINEKLDGVRREVDEMKDTINKRVKTLEKHAGVNPPPELVLAVVAV